MQMQETAEAFYSRHSYSRASDFANGASPSLESAFRFFRIACNGVEGDNKVEMALRAALKHEAVAFPG